MKSNVKSEKRKATSFLLTSQRAQVPIMPSFLRLKNERKGARTRKMLRNSNLSELFLPTSSSLTSTVRSCSRRTRTSLRRTS